MCGADWGEDGRNRGPGRKRPAHTADFSLCFVPTTRFLSTTPLGSAHPICLDQAVFGDFSLPLAR